MEAPLRGWGDVPRCGFDAKPELGNEEKTDGQECPSSRRCESLFTVTTLVSPTDGLDAERHCARRPGSSMSLIAGALLAVHAAILFSAAPHQAPTIDEVWHLPAGISYWQRGEFWCYHHNPPVMRWLLVHGKSVRVDDTTYLDFASSLTAHSRIAGVASSSPRATAGQ